MAAPRSAPIAARIRVSAKKGSTMRKRLAPSAVRTAASRVRSVARASSRFDTLAIAINRTKMVATCIAPNTASSSGPVSSSAKVRKRTVTPLLVSGYSRARRSAIAAISTAAWSRDTPSRSRPKTSNEAPRLRSAAWLRPSRRTTQRLWFWGKRKPSGMTPRIVAASPFTMTALPTMPGSDPYRVVQTSCPTTRVSGAPGSSSPGRKPVPIAGRIRSASNRLAETKAP